MLKAQTRFHQGPGIHCRATWSLWVGSRRILAINRVLLSFMSEPYVNCRRIDVALIISTTIPVRRKSLCIRPALMFYTGQRRDYISLRVQVLNNHTLTQDL